MANHVGNYNKVREPLMEWLAKKTTGTEFWYVTAAQELNLLKPSVSAALVSWMRRGVLIRPGHASGWYIVMAPGETNQSAPGHQQASDLRVNGAREAISKLLATGSEPEPDPAPEMMEVVGKTKDGYFLLKGDDGKIYRAEEM